MVSQLKSVPDHKTMHAWSIGNLLLGYLLAAKMMSSVIEYNRFPELQWSTIFEPPTKYWKELSTTAPKRNLLFLDRKIVV